MDEDDLDQYYILVDLKPVPATFPEFVEFCENDSQVVDETWINDTVRVITCFTGKNVMEDPEPDDPILLYETMVVGSKLPIAEAYTTNIGDAKAYHYDRVFELRKLYSSEKDANA